MALYGEQASVQKILRGSPSATLSADFAGKFEEAQVIVSSTLEQLIGRSFGDGAQTASERILWIGADGTLLLPVPARSISSILVNGYYDGTAYLDGVAIDRRYWLTDPIDRYGNILGVRLATGGAWGVTGRYGRPSTPIAVTAVWTDLADEVDPPDDITAIANYLIAERIKAQAAGASGVIGPDGSITPIRNPWKDWAVIQIIDKYRVNPTIAF